MKKSVLFGMLFLCSICMNVFAASPKTDPATYATRFGYSLSSQWAYTNTLGNYAVAADLLGATGTVRGMAVKDGKMLFIDRANKQIIIVNGTTGLKETPLKLSDSFFTYTGKNKAGTADSLWTAGVFTHNDIQIDNAGNVLVSNLINMDPGAKNRRFQVWNVNMTDGTGSLLIDSQMDELFTTASIRFDAFGVWGDVKNHAVILAANANAMEVYKWVIDNGVVSAPQLIEVDYSGEYWFQTKGDAGYPALANPGSAPRVLPLDDDYFYLDGNTTYPTLIDKGGNIMDGFYKMLNSDGSVKSANAYRALTDSISITGTKWTMNFGHNGVKEFQIGNDYFLILSATNTAGSPTSSFRVFKFADANKLFSGLDCMWTFPQAGMGGASNSYRTGMPAVEVNGNEAKIYVYTGENGYAAYTMSVSTGVNQTLVSAVNIALSNNKISTSEQVKSIEVYSVSGQRIATAYNVSEISAPSQKGIYLVRVMDNNGAKKSQKIAVQ